jgi:alpha-mannosidase
MWQPCAPDLVDFNDADNQVQDDPRRHDYNLDEWLDKFITAAVNLQNNTRTNHQMWPCGSDFNYQNADHWFHNLDKFIHYVNLNASRGGPVVAMYSTPTKYTSVKKAMNLTWEVAPPANVFFVLWSLSFAFAP